MARKLKVQGRLVHVLQQGPHIAKVRNNSDWNEWVAEIHPHGVHRPQADAGYLKNRKDAIEQAKAMLDTEARKTRHTNVPVSVLKEEDYTKIPKVSNLYEAYAKVYAQDTLGVDVESLEEAITSGTRRYSGRGRITSHNFDKIVTYGTDGGVYNYTQTATLPDGRRVAVRNGDVLKNLPNGGKGVMLQAWPVRITGGEGKGDLERVAGYTGQPSDINKLVGGKDGIKPKHAMRFRQTMEESHDYDDGHPDDVENRRDIARSRMTARDQIQKHADLATDYHRKWTEAEKKYNPTGDRHFKYTKRQLEVLNHFYQKSGHHQEKGRELYDLHNPPVRRSANWNYQGD